MVVPLSAIRRWSRRQRAPEPNKVGFRLVDSSGFNEGCRKGPNQPQISCLHSKFDVRPDRCRNIAISLVIGAPVLRSALTTPFILLMAVAGNLRKFGEPSQKKRQTAPKKICLRTWVGEADRARCTPPLTSRRGEARWSWRPRARP